MTNKNEKNMKEKLLKLPLAEVNPQFEVSLANVYKVSVEKGYTPNNWLDDTLVPNISLINAARRHINKHLSGEMLNVEEECQTITMHLECAAYGLLMAATQLRTNCKIK